MLIVVCFLQAFKLCLEKEKEKEKEKTANCADLNCYCQFSSYVDILQGFAANKVHIPRSSTIIISSKDLSNSTSPTQLLEHTDTKCSLYTIN